MKRTELAPGYSISRILKGGWQLAGGHGAVERDGAIDDMRAYAEAGITTFDCADIYTGVEERIGDFRRRHPDLARRVQVHTKYVPDLASLRTHDRGQVVAAVDRSLRRLGVEVLDVVQFHWWDYGVPGFIEAVQWLEELCRAGKIRHLAATNFDTPRFQALLDAGVDLVSHQVQYSLIDRRPTHGLSSLCGERDVKIIAYGSVLGGFFSSRWLGQPEPKEPLENRSLVKYRLIIEDFGGWPAFQRVLAAASDVGRKHGVSPSAVSLAWTLEQPHVAGVVAGVRHRRHLDDTLRAADVRLEDEDRAALRAVVESARGPAGDTYTLERIQGGPHAAIMKTDRNANSD